jgi:hypothetical protein
MQELRQPSSCHQTNDGKTPRLSREQFLSEKGKPQDDYRFLKKTVDFMEKFELRIDVRRLLERGYTSGEMRYLPFTPVYNCPSRLFISWFRFVVVC